MELMRQYRILVVDDDRSILKLVKKRPRARCL